MDLVWIIVLVVIAAIVLFLIVTYNGLVRLRNMVDEAWNQISVSLSMPLCSSAFTTCSTAASTPLTIAR